MDHVIYIVLSTDHSPLCIDHRARDCMVVGFTTTYEINDYHH